MMQGLRIRIRGNSTFLLFVDTRRVRHSGMCITVPRDDIGAEAGVVRVSTAVTANNNMHVRASQSPDLSEAARRRRATGAAARTAALAQ